MPQDIPLAEAVLCWTPALNDTKPTFHIGRLGDPRNDTGKHLMTAGAVYSAWKKSTKDKRIRMLFAEIMSIQARDQVPFDMIHQALLVIPEYRRDILSEDSPGAERDDD